MHARSLLVLSLALAGCAGAPPASALEEAEQFAVALDACMPRWFLPTAGFDPTQLANIAVARAAGDLRSRHLAPFQCVLDAGSDCVEVRACYGLRSEATIGPCMGIAPRCEGDTLLVCVPSDGVTPTQLGRVDCTVEDLHCVVSPTSAVTARCARRTCTIAGQTGCDGLDAFVCGADLYETSVPAPLHTRCDDSMGNGRFVGIGAPCDRTASCRGDVLLTCDVTVGRVRDEHDCAVLGDTCIDDGGGLAHCGGGPPPSCRELGASCEASVLRYCGGDGALHAFDCAANGYAGCEVTIAGTGCAPVGPRF